MKESEVPFDLMLEAARTPLDGFPWPVFFYLTGGKKPRWSWWKSKESSEVIFKTSRRQLTPEELAQWNVALMMANSSE